MSIRFLRPIAFLAVAAVVAVSCTGDSVGTSAVTEAPPSGAAGATDTNSTVAATSQPAASTTLASVTTSTPPTTPSPSTTSAVDTTYSWAEQPLVITGSAMGALGWWDGAEWVQAESDTTLPIDGGEDYQIVSLGDDRLVAGGPQIVVCDFSASLPGVELRGDRPAWPLTESGYSIPGVAISAPWELRPHLVEFVSDDGTYAALARELLQERGLAISEPVIKQLIQLDLEGDGIYEVLAVAEETEITISPQPGSYSIVFLRKITDAGVTTWLLAESVTTAAEASGPFMFAVGGVADLNNDAMMEIVVSRHGWESQSIAVFEYIDDDVGPEPVMDAGCEV